MSFRSLVVLVCLMAVGMLASGQLYILIPISDRVAAHFGVASASIPWLGMVFGLAYAVGFLFWGPASDWLGRKNVLLIGLCLTSLVSFAVAWAPSYNLEMAARIAQGLCAASIPPAGLALVSEMLSDRWRSTGQGMVSFSFIAAAPVAQFYAHSVDVSFPLLMTFGALSFAVVGVVLAFAGQQRDDHGVHRKHAIHKSLSELVSSPVIITVWATSLTVLFGFVTFQILLNGQLNVAGWSQVTIRLLTVLGMTASFFVGLIIRLFGDVRVLRVGLAASGFALAAAKIGLPLPFEIVLMSIGVSCSIAGIISAISRSASHATRGLAIAIYSFFLFIGASSAPIVARMMPSTMMLVAPIVFLVVAIALLGMPWMRVGPSPQVVANQ